MSITEIKEGSILHSILKESKRLTESPKLRDGLKEKSKRTRSCTTKLIQVLLLRLTGSKGLSVKRTARHRLTTNKTTSELTELYGAVLTTLLKMVTSLLKVSSYLVLVRYKLKHTLSLSLQKECLGITTESGISITLFRVHSLT